MAEQESRFLLQLARTLDDLLQIAAASSRRALEHLEASSEARSGPADLLARLIESAEGTGLEQLRESLRRELRRWSERAADDRAASQVRDLFAALLDVLEPDPGEADERPPAPRTAPRTRRAAHRRAP